MPEPEFVSFFPPSIGPNSKGTVVHYLHQFFVEVFPDLDGVGDLVDDGWCGPYMTQVIRNLQRDLKIEVNGFFDQATRDELVSQYPCLLINKLVASHGEYTEWTSPDFESFKIWPESGLEPVTTVVESVDTPPPASTAMTVKEFLLLSSDEYRALVG